MVEKTLLYVSRSLLAPTDNEVEIACIVAAGRSRNAHLGVTGALISTRFGFAQILEGDEAAIAELMDSILLDLRHTDLKIIEYAAISTRRFPTWRLAYRGGASYVDTRLEELLSPSPDPVQVARLVRLMEAFSRQEP